MPRGVFAVEGPKCPAASLPLRGTIWLNAIAWVLCLGMQRICARRGTVCDGVVPLFRACKDNANGQSVAVPGMLVSGKGNATFSVWAIALDFVQLHFAPASAPAMVPGTTLEEMVSALAGPRLPFLAPAGLWDHIPDRAEEWTLATALGRRAALRTPHAWCNASLGISAALRMVRPTLDVLDADLGGMAATF